MNDLERRLVDLGSRIDFPVTPPLAQAVQARLAAVPTRRRLPRWRLVAVALAAALAVVFGVPPVRTAIAHWLGITGVVIRPVQTLPAITPQSLTELGDGLALGQLSSLTAARARAGFAVAVPASLGAPDAVYVRTDLGPVITLLYRPRAELPEWRQSGIGLLITEFRGGVDPTLFQKLVPPGATVKPVTVGGGAGYWISAAHAIAYQLPDGSIAPDSVRLAGPTLIFERGDVSVRIEGAASEDRALALAAALR
jgi:hypothetical protein